MTLLVPKKRRKFNLETCLSYLDYVKAFDEVKGDKLFETLQSKNIPNLLLKSDVWLTVHRNSVWIRKTN